MLLLLLLVLENADVLLLSSLFLLCLISLSFEEIAAAKGSSRAAMVETSPTFQTTTRPLSSPEARRRDADAWGSLELLFGCQAMAVTLEPRWLPVRDATCVRRLTYEVDVVVVMGSW